MHGKMWSRSFLIWGLVTGTVVAALALAGLWLVLSAVSLAPIPVLFCMPGLLIYPACWYAVVFRAHSYSTTRVFTLVAVTFGAVWLLMIIVMSAVGLYFAYTIVAHGANKQDAMLLAGVHLTLPLVTVIGAIILVIPYFVVATPIAFLHRSMLLNKFAPGTSGGGRALSPTQ